MGSQDAIKLRAVARDKRITPWMDSSDRVALSPNAHKVTTKERCSSLGWTIRSATDNFF